jgi:hypothetical protein
MAAVMTLDTIHDRCTDDGDCWIWSQGTTNTGYPQARHEGKSCLVRRVAVVLAGKSLRRGYVVVDTCGRTLCCNPGHLAVITYGEMMRRTCESGARSSPSEYVRRRDAAIRLGMSKITLAIAREIRASDEPAQIFAERYGMHVDSIRSIRRGDHWRESMPNASVFNLATA